MDQELIPAAPECESERVESSPGSGLVEDETLLADELDFPRGASRSSPITLARASYPYSFSSKLVEGGGGAISG